MAPKKSRAVASAEEQSAPGKKSVAEQLDVKGWNPIKVEKRLSVQGGLLKQPHVLETIDVLVGGRQERFAKILKMKVG